MMTSKAGWCTWYKVTLHPYAQYEERFRDLAERSKPILDELAEAEAGTTRLEGNVYALALLVEQYVSLNEDDPVLIGVLQQLFYELPKCIPELNRSFFELEVYPILSIITICE